MVDYIVRWANSDQTHILPDKMSINRTNETEKVPISDGVGYFKKETTERPTKTAILLDEYHK